MSRKKVYICYTYYHLYVAILETIHRKEKENYVIITDHIPDASFIKNQLQKSRLFKKIYYVEDLKMKGRILSNPVFCIFYCFFLNVFFKKENIDLYNEFKDMKETLMVNMFLDSTTTSHFYIYNFKKISLVEDGTLIYYPRKKILKDYLYDILFIPKRVGRDKRIKEIRVQEPKKLPKDIINKGKILELKKYENSLNKIIKKEIVDIFLPNFDINISKTLKNERCLLLTQPISEMGYVTEQEKIEIYKKILEKYNNYEIFIKKHPKDLTKYPFQVKELNKNFPIELLKFFPERFFSKIIAIESSAIFNLKDISDAINLGYEIDKKLYINIMKDKK